MIIKDGGFTKKIISKTIYTAMKVLKYGSRERKNYITMEIYPDREEDKIRSRGKFIRIGIKFYDVLNHRQQTTFQ